MKKSVASLLLALGAIPLFAADEKPANPQTLVYRVTGLFDHGREADLRSVLETLSEVQLVSLDFDHAEGTFRYDPAKAFPGTKPDDLIKKFDEKIRQASAGTFGIKPLSTTPHEQWTKVEIAVVGLDCRACSLAAYEAVAKLDGVEQATASFHEGRITAQIDPARVDRPKLEAALKEKRVELKAN